MPYLPPMSIRKKLRLMTMSITGIALLLSGIGFAILAIGGALRSKETGFEFINKRAAKTQAAPAA